MKWALAALLVLVLAGAIAFSLLSAPPAPAATDDGARPAPAPAPAPDPSRPPPPPAAEAEVTRITIPESDVAASSAAADWAERWKDVALQPSRAERRASPLHRAITNAVRYEVADCAAGMAGPRPASIDTELFLEATGDGYRVLHADVGGELDPAARQCMARAFEKELHLPATKEGTRLRLSFTLPVHDPLPP